MPSSLNPVDSASELAELVECIAQREWADESSVSYKNRASVPGEARRGFIVFADMGGVCVLDPSGAFRVFLHDEAQEIAASEMAVRCALSELARQHPRVWALLTGTDGSSR